MNPKYIYWYYQTRSIDTIVCWPKRKKKIEQLKRELDKAKYGIGKQMNEFLKKIKDQWKEEITVW